MSYPRLGQSREEIDERLMNERVHPLVTVEARLDAGAEMVGSAPSTESDSAVARSLSIDDEVAEVIEGLAVAQPDLAERVVADRLGGDHE